MIRLSEIKDQFKGQDIYVLGSGPSLNFVKPEFFQNKIAISSGLAYEHFSCVYAVGKDVPEQFPRVNDIKIIASKHIFGGRGRLNIMHCDYYFDHQLNMKDQIRWPEGDQIVVSWSTITSAIHVAAYLGAATIILCGHDCGTIDGTSRYGEYYNQGCDLDWVTKIEAQTIQVKDWIKRKYDCDIYSLNPFINLGAEGHVYEGT